jgi:3-hydroxyisobutyrate dehydrogenase-like beta-hydroxyacid dehydrogenase
MGAAMGGHLLDAGTPLAVYDVAPEACRPLVDRGANARTSPAEVAADADVVLVVVVDDAQTRDAVTASLERARAGAIIALCASIRPDTCAELEAEGRTRGVHVVDAALVRGERGAEEGRLVLYCGGDADAVALLEQACAPFTEAVVRVGGIGAGQVAKTANNILLWANLRADVEALRLGRALRDALALGSGANRPLAEWGKHRLRWPHKDLEVALAVAGEAGVDMPLVERLAELMQDLTLEDLQELR